MTYTLSQFCDKQKTRIKRRLNGDFFLRGVTRVKGDRDLDFQRLMAVEDCEELRREDDCEFEYRRGPALAAK